MKQIGLRVSDELAEQIRVARGDVPQNTWIVRAIEEKLHPLMVVGTVGGNAEAGGPVAVRLGGLGKGYVAPIPKKPKR